MPVRRPAAASAAAVAVAALLAGCGPGAVDVRNQVAEGALSDAERARCEALVEALPDRLFGQERRDVESGGIPAAAWGDPAVVLVCGAEEPEEYDEFASCTPVGGAGWFMPDSQLRATSGPIEVTAMSHSPRLLLVVPPELRDRGADTALVTLGPLVVEHLEETLPCH